MSNECVELVVYSVSDAETAAALRRGVMPMLAVQPGFLRWEALQGIADARQFADLVRWRSFADAKSASEAVSDDPRFAEFMAATADVVSFVHYATTDAREAA